MIPQTLRRQQAAGRTRRESTRYPGLVLELDGCHLAFKYGSAREVFKLKDGDAELAACTDDAYSEFELFDYVRATAVAYAEALQRAPR